MKILFINNYKEISVGGDSRVAWELARSFAEYTDHEVWMIKPGDKFYIERDVKSRNLMTYSFPGEDVNYHFHIYRTSTHHIRKIFKILNEISPDVIHGHVFDPLCYIAQSWALNHNVPFLYTSHILPSSSTSFTPGVKYLDILSDLIKIPLDTYAREFYKGCSSIIALNQSAKNDFVNFLNGDEVRYDIIPNGTYMDQLSSDERRLPDINEPLKLAFAGHLSRRKNQSYLLEALNLTKTQRKIEVTLYGVHSEPDYYEEIRELKDKLESNRPNITVKLPGHTDHSELMAGYKDIHFFISAATKEVQSLVIIEALGAGIPMVALENETTREFLIDGENGYLLKKNAHPSEFAKKIDKLISISNDQYKDFSKRASKAVEDLKWENVVHRTEGLYSELISKYNKKEKLTGLERIKSMFKLEEEPNLEKPRENNKKNNSKRFIILSLIASITVAFLAIFNIGTRIKRSSEKIKSKSSSK